MAIGCSTVWSARRLHRTVGCEPHDRSAARVAVGGLGTVGARTVIGRAVHTAGVVSRSPKARPYRSGIAPRQHRHRRSVSTPQMHPRKGQQMIERKAIIESARAARITAADSRSAYDFIDWAQHQLDLLL